MISVHDEKSCIDESFGIAARIITQMGLSTFHGKSDSEIDQLTGISTEVRTILKYTKKTLRILGKSIGSDELPTNIVGLIELMKKSVNYLIQAIGYHAETTLNRFFTRYTMQELIKNYGSDLLFPNGSHQNVKLWENVHGVGVDVLYNIFKTLNLGVKTMALCIIVLQRAGITYDATYIKNKRLQPSKLLELNTLLKQNGGQEI